MLIRARPILPRLRPRVVIPSRPGRPLPPWRRVLGVVIRRVRGHLFHPWRAWGWGWSGASRASPSAMAAGAGGGRRSCLWWYSILSTRHVGTWFYRPVTTIGCVIRPDFLRKRKLAKFFRVNDNLQKFFMGDLCVNANQH